MEKVHTNKCKPKQTHESKVPRYLSNTRLNVHNEDDGEKNAEKVYADIISVVPDAKWILEDETAHEKQLLAKLASLA